MGMLARQKSTYVDNAAHMLHHAGRCFPCDRDVEALALWNGHALLLSSDTDCLSLWDSEGLIRTARVGVYPQDMAVAGSTAYVCGGADGMLHLLDLPELRESSDFLLPGMPERVCIHENKAYILTLLSDDDVQTALLRLDLPLGASHEIMRFPGLPGTIAADGSGLWTGVSELVLHLPYGAKDADLLIKGFGLPRYIEVQSEGVLVVDELEDRTIFIRI